MIAPDAEPIAHHPPLKPIELRPRYPDSQKEHWEEQIEEMARCAALSRGERLWAIVVEFARARGGNVPSAPSKPTDGPLGEAEGLSSAESSDWIWRPGFTVWRPAIRDLGAEIGMPPIHDTHPPTPGNAAVSEDGRNTTEATPWVGPIPGSQEEAELSGMLIDWRPPIVRRRYQTKPMHGPDSIAREVGDD